MRSRRFGGPCRETRLRHVVEQSREAGREAVRYVNLQREFTLRLASDPTCDRILSNNHLQGQSSLVLVALRDLVSFIRRVSINPAFSFFSSTRLSLSYPPSRPTQSGTPLLSSPLSSSPSSHPLFSLIHHGDCTESTQPSITHNPPLLPRSLDPYMSSRRPTNLRYVSRPPLPPLF